MVRLLGESKKHLKNAHNQKQVHQVEIYWKTGTAYSKGEIKHKLCLLLAIKERKARHIFALSCGSCWYCFTYDTTSDNMVFVDFWRSYAVLSHGLATLPYAGRYTQPNSDVIIWYDILQ